MTQITRLCLFALLLFITNVFAKSNNFSSEYNDTEATFSNSEIQRVRIYFTTPNGFVRYLLLSFTSDGIASDGFDFGYDALNIEDLPDDLNWMIEEQRYVIQGVGAFDNTKKYPLGLFLKNAGEIKIDLFRLENFDTPIEIYIYDAYLNTYTKINEASFAMTMESGDYIKRFYVAFSDNLDTNSIAKTSLSTEDETLEKANISYLQNTKELFIKANTSTIIKTITIFNQLGQKVYVLGGLEDNQIKMSIPNLKDGYSIVSVETDNGYMISKQIFIN
ncbi:hypothetical protein [Tamlana flava]|uniref:hypothetical protein n=1 Tax=Tamlana flava TaxID=3158572 RepID=UPI00351B7A47